MYFDRLEGASGFPAIHVNSLFYWPIDKRQSNIVKQWQDAFVNQNPSLAHLLPSKVAATCTDSVHKHRSFTRKCALHGLRKLPSLHYRTQSLFGVEITMAIVSRLEAVAIRLEAIASRS